jgi:hypothetical protein
MSLPLRPVVLRGRAEPEREQQILALWSAHGALLGATARQRLAEVVCALVDDAHGVVAVCSAYRDDVAHLGGRPFWVYRRFLAPGVGAEAEAMLVNAAFAALEAEAAEQDDAPVGLCVLVEDRSVLAGRPEVVWADTDLTYAGYLDDGTQVRIRYFDGAKVA